MPDEVVGTGTVDAAPSKATPIHQAAPPCQTSQYREKQQRERRTQGLHEGGLTFQEEILNIMRDSIKNIVIRSLEGSERDSCSRIPFRGVATTLHRRLQGRQLIRL